MSQVSKLDVQPPAPALPPKPERRFELDSLRGLAAATVVVCHFLNILPAIHDDPQSGPLWYLVCTPLRIFSAGHEAVVFFFVLSGFVLAIPFLAKPQPYPGFIIKRFFRIWTPYMFAVVLGFACYAAFAGPLAPGLSLWAQGPWRDSITARTVVDHVLLIGSFKNNAYNPVLWSLVLEMRISILFPLIIWMVKRFDWKTCLGISFVIYLIGRAGAAAGTRGLIPANDYFDTLVYVYMFTLGALMAKHIGPLSDVLYRRRSRMFRRLILLGALALYVYRYLYPGMPELLVRVLHDFPTTLAVFVFIIVASGSASASRLLRLRPFVFLGKVSYSLYLLHAIMLLVTIHTLYGRYSVWTCWGVALAMTAVITVLSYYFVEEPSMKLGRYLASRVRPAPTAPAAR